MKRVFLFSRDPGAANCIIPVYKKLQEDNQIEVFLYGKDFSLDNYKKENLVFFDLGALIGEVNKENVFEFLKISKFDLIITGVGSNDFTDRFIWQEAKKFNIPTIVILDQWLNYRMRFSLNIFENSTQEMILPDKICVMDSFAKAEMIKEGFPPDKLVVTGQPHFERVLKINSSIEDKQKELFREKYKIGVSDKVLTFACEPLAETYGTSEYWGYDQFTIFGKLVGCLERIALADNSRKIILFIKTHPRNNKREIDKFFSKYSLPDNLILQVIGDVAPLLIIAVSDLVLGMSSMFLLEAAIVGKPFYSVQIGLTKKNPFVLQRIGVSKTILDDEELFDKLNRFIGNKEFNLFKPFKIIDKAVYNIFNLINTVLYEK